jgi:hypothetical protein
MRAVLRQLRAWVDLAGDVLVHDADSDLEALLGETPPSRPSCVVAAASAVLDRFRKTQPAPESVRDDVC